MAKRRENWDARTGELVKHGDNLAVIMGGVRNGEVYHVLPMNRSGYYFVSAPRGELRSVTPTGYRRPAAERIWPRCTHLDEARWLLRMTIVECEHALAALDARYGAPAGKD